MVKEGSVKKTKKLTTQHEIMEYILEHEGCDDDVGDYGEISCSGFFISPNPGIKCPLTMNTTRGSCQRDTRAQRAKKWLQDNPPVQPGPKKLTTQREVMEHILEQKGGCSDISCSGQDGSLNAGAGCPISRKGVCKGEESTGARVKFAKKWLQDNPAIDSNTQAQDNKEVTKEAVPPQSEKDGGSTPSQYAFPDGAKELQDLIEHRGMDFSLGNIFKAVYRMNNCKHSDPERDLRKILYFAERKLSHVTGKKHDHYTK